MLLSIFDVRSRAVINFFLSIATCLPSPALNRHTMRAAHAAPYCAAIRLISPVILSSPIIYSRRRSAHGLMGLSLVTILTADKVLALGDFKMFCCGLRIVSHFLSPSRHRFSFSLLSVIITFISFFSSSSPHAGRFFELLNMADAWSLSYLSMDTAWFTLAPPHYRQSQ